MTYQGVPIEVAKQISDLFGKDQVIIVTWDHAHQMQHIVTFGRSPLHSAQAAEGGNFVKRALGWPDRLCHDTPDWYKNSLAGVGILITLAEKLGDILSASIPDLGSAEGTLQTTPIPDLGAAEETLRKLHAGLVSAYRSLAVHKGGSYEPQDN